MKAKRLMALLLCLLTVIGIIPAGTALAAGNTVTIESQTNSAFDYLQYYAATERRLEKYLLEHVEEKLSEYIRQVEITASEPKISKPQQDKFKIKEKIRRLNVVYMAGGKSDDEYQVEMAELNKLLRLAEQEEPETTTKDLSSLKEFLDNGLNRELYDSLTQAEKRLLWRSLIDEIHFEGINVKDIKFKHAPALKVAVNQ